MYAARSRLAWRARAALRPRGSRASSFSASTAEETVDWPIIAGGALGVGLLLSGLALKRQAWLQKVQSRSPNPNPSPSPSPNPNLSPSPSPSPNPNQVQSRVDIVPSGGTIADVSVRQLVGLTMAFALTQLPVEETKLKLLAAGGLQGWAALLGCFELDQQQIALGALTALTLSLALTLTLALTITLTSATRRRTLPGALPLRSRLRPPAPARRPPDGPRPC